MVTGKLKKTSIEDNVHQTASYIADQPAIYQTSQPAPHWLAPNHEIHLRVVTKKTSHCLWFSLQLPALHGAMMGNESALALLKSKGKAVKKSFICNKASVRHISLRYNTAVAILNGRMFCWGNICIHNIWKHIICSMFKASHYLCSSSAFIVHNWILIMLMNTQIIEIVSLYC